MIDAIEGLVQDDWATACSKTSASRDWGIVVGRIILFLMRLRTPSSGSLKGTQRITFSMPASASTLETE